MLERGWENVECKANHSNAVGRLSWLQLNNKYDLLNVARINNQVKLENVIYAKKSILYCYYLYLLLYLFHLASQSSKLLVWGGHPWKNGQVVVRNAYSHES